MSSQTKLARLEVRVEQLEEDNDNLLRKLELVSKALLIAEETLRAERTNQQRIAGRASYGNGYRQ